MNAAAETLFLAIAKRDAADLEALRRFAQDVLEDFPESVPDGFEIQELAEEHGLIERVTRASFCVEPNATGDRPGCSCCGVVDDAADGFECFRKTRRLEGLTPAKPDTATTQG